MTKYYVLDSRFLPVRSPELMWAVVWLLLDRFKAPDALMYTYWCLVALAVLVFYTLLRREITCTPQQLLTDTAEKLVDPEN